MQWRRTCGMRVREKSYLNHVVLILRTISRVRNLVCSSLFVPCYADMWPCDKIATLEDVCKIQLLLEVTEWICSNDTVDSTMKDYAKFYGLFLKNWDLTKSILAWHICSLPGIFIWVFTCLVRLNSLSYRYCSWSRLYLIYIIWQPIMPWWRHDTVTLST